MIGIDPPRATYSALAIHTASSGRRPVSLFMAWALSGVTVDPWAGGPDAGKPVGAWETAKAATVRRSKPAM